MQDIFLGSLLDDLFHSSNQILENLTLAERFIRIYYCIKLDHAEILGSGLFH